VRLARSRRATGAMGFSAAAAIPGSVPFLAGKII
jgi:hypothetical protein